MGYIDKRKTRVIKRVAPLWGPFGANVFGLQGHRLAGEGRLLVLTIFEPMVGFEALNAKKVALVAALCACADEVFLETLAAHETIWACNIEEDLDLFRVMFPEPINVGLGLFELIVEIIAEAVGDWDLLHPDADIH